MKLTVFGATGGIGQEIVKQALAAGHQVTAVVRDPARLTVTGDALDVFRSELRDAESLSDAVAGRDAVLSGLGARSNNDARTGIAAALTRPVLQALDATGTRRFLAVSAGPLAPEPPDQKFLHGRVMVLINAILKPVYDDLKVMEAEIRRSGADWTLVRPPKLLDRPVTGTYRTALNVNLRGGSTIGRADVAHAMLASVDDPATVKQGVSVAY
ncbi:NAD(P)-dependent oxidoreductase [Streptomyces cavernicola]|uniref:SDR family oxidoreductase n=1 Tax=Streptomyces cavernicola TaxID=3043613 RepID=A0ABT6SK32_9ACTN|nr:SDR family oxidoreductase [Streptomyces sp. B-S-A6]MDI3408541.1 SDR family oxidoreductase [Streptomyces sp. B-S-A6]